MATTREGIVGIVARKLGSYGIDGRGMEPDDYVDEARILYERIKPRERAVKIAGSAAYSYALSTANFAGFDPDFSTVLAVEYPIDQLPEPQFIDRNEWRVLRTEAANLLLVLPTIVPVTDFIRVTYTSRHTLAGGATPSSTIPDGDDYAVAGFAGHYACLALAARLNRERSNPSIDGELALGFAERAGEARRAADDFLADANRILGLSTTAPGSGGGEAAAAAGKPVLVVHDTDIRPGGRRGRWLTHSPLDR